MKRFAGLDVSLSTTSICVVDGQGRVVFEGVVTTDPDASEPSWRHMELTWSAWKPGRCRSGCTQACRDMVSRPC